MLIGDSMVKDEALILLLKSKDENAFQAIFKKYYKLVKGVINNIVKDDSVSEELVNDTFLKMYNAIGTFDETKKISPWLTTIAKNLAINYINRNDKNIVYSQSIVENDAIENEKDTTANDIIESYLDGIEYEVVKLRIIDDYTYEEIKETLGISLSESYRKYKSGIKKIKERVNG